MENKPITECKKRAALEANWRRKKNWKIWARFLKGGEEELREAKKEALVKNKQKGTREKGRTKIKK